MFVLLVDAAGGGNDVVSEVKIGDLVGNLNTKGSRKRGFGVENL